MTRHALGDADRHFYMTRSVARVMGVNLTDAMAEGAITPAIYAGMVTRCRGCALVEACEAWLATSDGASATPPPGCHHTEILVRLRRAQTRRPG